MEDGLHALHERLLAEQPSNSKRGEETETLALGKILRTVVAEVKLSHVAVVEGGRQTTGKALLAIVLNATIVVCLLVVEQHGIHVKLAETTVVHQIRFEVHVRITIFRTLLRAHGLVTRLKLRVNQVTLFVTTSGGEYGGRLGCTTATATVPAVEAEQCLGFQTWRKHLQVLLDTEQRLYLTRGNEVITLLRHGAPRVGTV